MKADPDAALERWARENAEWMAIKNEMLDRGQTPTAWDVTEEQVKRMLERGDVPMMQNESDRRALGISPRRAKYLERRASHLRRVK
jgi:hypothetical protein